MPSLGEIRKTGGRYGGHPVPGVLVPEHGENNGGYIKGC